PDRVELVETHISWVFLAGDRVVKIKRPVTLDFVDQSTPERRRGDGAVGGGADAAGGDGDGRRAAGAAAGGAVATRRGPVGCRHRGGAAAAGAAARPGSGGGAGRDGGHDAGGVRRPRSGAGGAAVLTA